MTAEAAPTGDPLAVDARAAGSGALPADVLVLGGGPAGAWAAIAAAEAGARVVLADKGYCGTSGATASGGNNLWYIDPAGDARRHSIAERERDGGYLTEQRWMVRTLEQTWECVERLAAWGYPFPVDENDRELRASLQGPQYMRLLRHRAQRAGVRILDHSPAQQLLTDAEGVVSGAAGVHRQDGSRPWQVKAGAVVIATGGCAFLSGALGTNPDTGDGHLMAAEAGAVLSGMEFSNVYGMAPGFGTQTKGRMYQFASYYHADGTPLDVPPGFAGRAAVARLMLHETVHARLDQAPAAIHDTMRWAQPNFFLPFDKAGIDPFTQLFPVRLVLEGTVRGTGGLNIVDDGCATGVPGLYAAGDAATRELITGGRSGGGSHNGAWAMSSGTWSGAAAARFARTRAGAPERRPVRARGVAGLGVRGHGPGARPGTVPAEDVIRAVQQQVFPLERNLFRTGAPMATALHALDELWHEAVPGLAPVPGPRAHRSREAAALVAHARWMYAGALARTESRGMHRREDFPGSDDALTVRLLSGGLDEVWVSPAAPRELEIAS